MKQLDTDARIPMPSLARVSVYFMSCVSANVIKMTRPLDSKSSVYNCVILWLLLVYTLVQFFFYELRFLVTDHDIILLIVLWLFAAVEALCMTVNVVTSVRRPARRNAQAFSEAQALLIPKSRESPDTLHTLHTLHTQHTLHTVDPVDVACDPQLVGGISVYTACLLMMTARVHYTFDNPYLHILTVIFGFRTWMKIVVTKTTLTPRRQSIREMRLGEGYDDSGYVSSAQGEEYVRDSKDSDKSEDSDDSGNGEDGKPPELQAVGLYGSRSALLQSLLVGLDMACFATLLIAGVGYSADTKFDAIQHQVMILIICMLIATLIMINKPSQSITIAEYGNRQV